MAEEVAASQPVETAVVAPLERTSLHQGMSFGMDEVFPGVFVGGDASARDKQQLQSHGITHILNCASSDCSEYHPGTFQYLSFNIKDTHSETIESLFYEAIAFIDGAAEAGGKVLVHCEMGMSRSVAICMAYIIFKTGHTFAQVLSSMQEKRPVISPNTGFQAQLMDWRNRLYGSFPYPRIYAASTHHPKRSLKSVLRLVRSSSLGEFRLDPRGVFVVQGAKDLFLWTGAEVNPLAEPLYTAAAKDYITYLQSFEGADQTLVELQQGTESDSFWLALYPNDPRPSDLYAAEPTWDRWYAVNAKLASSRGETGEKSAVAAYVYPELVGVQRLEELEEKAMVCVCAAQTMFVWVGTRFEADTFSTEEYIDLVKRQQWDSPIPDPILLSQGSEPPEFQSLLSRLQSTNSS